MQSSRPGLAWLWYSLIRLGVFAVALTLLLILLPDQPLVAAIVAAVIAFCVSYIFLAGPRDAVARQIVAARSGEGAPSATALDDDAEDAALDGGESSTSAERRPGDGVASDSSPHAGTGTGADGEAGSQLRS